jgi:hypothetical protein
VVVGNVMGVVGATVGAAGGIGAIIYGYMLMMSLELKQRTVSL